jgi:hypothetical protein
MTTYEKAYNAGRELAIRHLASDTQNGLEKQAFATRILKPISNSYTGRALADRIAPMGWRRIGSEMFHGLGDFATGAGLAHALGADAEIALASGGLTSGIGSYFNQMRADKYLNKALKGSNALKRKDLQYLLDEMGTLNTALGSDNLVELIGSMDAKQRVRDALRTKIL